MSAVEEVAGNLLLLTDSVNVGLLRCGERALAIDCGTGSFVDALADVGIRHLDWVLATHHHRDGCSGLARCRASGAQLAVPAAEQALFDDVERHWLAPESQFHRYRLQPGTNVLSTSVAIDRALAGGDTVAWERYAIQVVATPGHTEGSLSYVVDCAGTRVAFVGDLLYGDGQFWELWSLQGPPPDDPVGMHDYHAFCGHGRQALASLEHLLNAYAPAVLVPAHGPLIRDPAAGLAALRRNLEALLANYYHTSS
ncbi:MAG TPA: MBL fold metallo-hydrolase, partial [Chloroflexota bacterium]